jgi:hypothetical protein
MTLFIRTQDKTKLIEANCVVYETKRKIAKRVHNESVHEEIIEEKHNLVCCGRLLGEYASKERCFEIIAEVQNKIENEKAFQSITYNMPEA